jgi:hypothetical protein
MCWRCAPRLRLLAPFWSVRFRFENESNRNANSQKFRRATAAAKLKQTPERDAFPVFAVLGWRLIAKNENRFSDKIMRNQESPA